jgi:hypothetical protein
MMSRGEQAAQAVGGVTVLLGKWGKRAVILLFVSLVVASGLYLKWLHDQAYDLYAEAEADASEKFEIYHDKVMADHKAIRELPLLANTPCDKDAGPLLNPRLVWKDDVSSMGPDALAVVKGRNAHVAAW